MPKSNRGVFSRTSGTVTVIEEPVLRSYRRKAKIVFWITWLAVTVLAASILVKHWQPRLGTTGASAAALIVGALIGAAVAFIAASIVIAWPVIRAIWWWMPELAIGAALFTGWAELAAHASLMVLLAGIAACIGIPAAVTPVRRRLAAASWCLISRHRIRTCFAEFIIANRTGSLPFILAARPTRAGERLWVWLRPDLSLEDVQDRADKIATACWATTVIADQAHPSNAALVRIDIKRRDPLTGRAATPLTQWISDRIPGRKPAPAPAGLDLADVTAADVTPAKAATGPGHRGRPQWPALPGTARDGEPGSDGNRDNIEDWI